MYASNVVNDSKRLQTSDFINWIFLSIPLFFLPTSKDVFNFPKAVLLYSLVIGSLIHFLLSPKSEKNTFHMNGRLIQISLLGILCFVSASALFTETSSMRALFGYPNRSNGLLTYLAFLMLFFVTSRMSISVSFLVKLQRYLFILIISFLSYSLVQYLDLDPISWNNSYNRVIGTLGNPNFSGAFLGIASAILLYYFISEEMPVRYFYLALSLLTCFLGWATESFQALMIFVIGVLFLALAQIKSRYGIKTFISAVTASVLIGAISFFSFIGFGPLGERLLQPTLVLRLEYWKVGVKTALSFPLLGIGPDSYGEGWRLFRTPEFVKAYSEDVDVDSAHNVLINFAANYGIPAFLLLCVIYILVGFSALRLIFGNHQIAPIAKAVALLWLLLLIQSLFSLEQIGLHALQWVAGSLLVNQSFIVKSQELLEKDTKRINVYRDKGGFSARGEIAVISALITFSAFLPLLNQEIRLSRLGATVVDKSASQNFVDQALYGFGNYTRKEIGRAIVISDFLLRAERYLDAQLVIEEVVKDEPRAYEGVEQLARLAGFRGEYLMEIEYRRKIESFDPQNYRNLISLAEAYRVTGNLDMARSYARKAISISKETKVSEIARSIIKGS